MITDEQDFIPCIVTNKGIFRLCPYHVEKLYTLIPPHEMELMRCTGLPDINGKLIYQGDIVKYYDYCYNHKVDQVHIGEVVYRENNACLIVERVLIDGKAVKREYGKSLLQHQHIEVLGNIYEDPKKLEVVA